MDQFIQVFKPSFGDEELDALREPFRTGWIGLGPKTLEFEEKFAEYVGAKYAVATNSATAALHLTCLVLGIGPGDEVLVPTMTFISTAHAPVYCGATPVFVDVEPDTLNISIDSMAQKVTAHTKAIIPVHYGGHACRMDEIWEFAKKQGLYVIEDAAHACGSLYKNQHIGGLKSTVMTSFSFHAVKNLAVGDGGMITTDHLEIVRNLKRLRWVGIDKSTWDRTEEVEMEIEKGTRRYSNYGWYYEVQDLGYKYHMNDIAASIGLVQLSKLDKANARRREIVKRYNHSLKDVEWIDIPVEHDYTTSAMHNYVIRTSYRDELNLYLKEKQIATGVHYMPVHLHPYYRRTYKGTLPIAEGIWQRLLTLPLYPDLTDEQVDYIIESILSFGKLLEEK